MGSSTSTPSSDQVPELRKAIGLSAAGTAATALAVSCEPTAITSTAPSPVSRAISSFRVPLIVPGRMILPNRCSGRPKLCMVSNDQLRDLALSNSEVEAIQYSLLGYPCQEITEEIGHE